MPLVQVGPGRYVDVKPNTTVQEVIHFVNKETGRQDQYVVKEYIQEPDDDETSPEDSGDHVPSE